MEHVSDLKRIYFAIVASHWHKLYRVSQKLNHFKIIKKCI